MTYNPWPLGNLPREWQRAELIEIMDEYDIAEPWDVVSLFEQKIAEFAGARYGVAVDSCTNALQLALECINAKKHIYIPNRTYVSVPQAIYRAVGKFPVLKEMPWSYGYWLAPYYVYDGAVSFHAGMYHGGLHCLSFQIKKRLPIGRGGMILLNDDCLAQKLRRMAHDGRDVKEDYAKSLTTYGYHMYMTPEDAARGLLLFNQLKRDKDWPSFEPVATSENYPDLKEIGQCL